MTRINRTGNTGPQSIQSQDAGGSQQISKPESQRNQEPGAAEQQQSKQAAQGRKNEMDLQGTVKQSQLAQFHGPGRSHGLGPGKMDPCNALPVDDDDKDLKIQDAVKATLAGAVAGGPGGALIGSAIGGVSQPHGEQRLRAELQEAQKDLSDMIRLAEGKRMAKEAKDNAKKLEEGGFDVRATEILEKHFPTNNKTTK